MESSKKIKDYTLKNKKGYKLTEDQNEVVEALLKNDNFFNFSQTGFGKTLTTITAAVHKMVERREEDIHFVLIIPPKAVKVFRDTLTNILGLPFNLYTAEKIKVQEGARFHIFNYSTIGKDVVPSKAAIAKAVRAGKPLEKKYNPIFERFKALKKKHKNLWLIADEAHMLQDPNTIQYRFVSAVNKLFVGRWLLTATPILNDLEGLFHMAVLVDPTFSHGNIHAFRNKYMVYRVEPYFITVRGKVVRKESKILIGYKNLDILQDRLSKISIVKSKQYNIDFQYRETNLSPESERYYKWAAEGLFSGTINKRTKKIKKSKQEHAGARLHDLQRVVSNSHPEFQYLKDKNLVTEKEALLVRTIKEIVDSNEAVLIYFSYLETLERVKYILNVLKDKLGLTGIYEVSSSITTAQRRRVEKLITPKSVVLITSAGTESINLQRANNMIFYEIPFSIKEFIQACGRITRINSEYDKFKVYILEAVGTIDTYKKNRLVANMPAIQRVLGSKNTLNLELAEISLQDIQDMKNEYLWWK